MSAFTAAAEHPWFTVILIIVIGGVIDNIVGTLRGK